MNKQKIEQDFREGDLSEEQKNLLKQVENEIKKYLLFIDEIKQNLNNEFDKD